MHHTLTIRIYWIFELLHYVHVACAFLLCFGFFFINRCCLVALNVFISCFYIWLIELSARQVVAFFSLSASLRSVFLISYGIVWLAVDFVTAILALNGATAKIWNSYFKIWSNWDKLPFDWRSQCFRSINDFGWQKRCKCKLRAQKTKKSWTGNGRSACALWHFRK